MLCTLCSNIDLDQLSTREGYKHHASCAELLQSAEQGCESCRLIWDTQSCETGGDLSDQNHDLGPLEKQIIARTVNPRPGNYTKIRYGQEKRRLDHQSKLMTKYSPSSDNRSSVEHPFLWSFLSIASASGMQYS
jgi:hypothetical protein